MERKCLTLDDMEEIKQDFNDWLYANYTIGNGHQLVALLEDTNVQDLFINEFGLPDDIDLY